MRQHGFFVDVVSLDAAEASLAAGPPRPETLDAWEQAVRKAYEQHVRRLQRQMVVADTKAVEMGLNLRLGAPKSRSRPLCMAFIGLFLMVLHAFDVFFVCLFVSPEGLDGFGWVWEGFWVA